MLELSKEKNNLKSGAEFHSTGEVQISGIKKKKRILNRNESQPEGGEKREGSGEKRR